MPIFSTTFPTIDANLNGVWSQQDTNLYNKLPYYLEVAKAEKRKHFSVWPRLIPATRRWQPNMADTLRLVIVEDSPVLRQEARPNFLSQAPKRDIYNVRERTVETRLHWQQFVSPHFYFLPSYQDFMKGNLLPAKKNIETQISLFEEFFYRTYLWDNAPYFYIAGYGLVDMTQYIGVNSDGTTKKTADVMQNALVANGVNLAQMTLTFGELHKAHTVFTEEIGATPYEGSGMPAGDSNPLDERYCFVTSPEAWNAFVDDPWLKENRQLNMNIVTEAFRGDLWGRIRCKLERFPQRYALSETVGGWTLHAPQSIDNTTNRTRPNPSYADVETSQVEVGWLVGGNFAERLESGPPPEFFAGATSDPSKIAGMSWNGMVYSSRNFLVPYQDANGATLTDVNDFGHYIRFQAELNCGIIGPNMQNVMPILYRRRRVAGNTVLSV